MGLFKRKRRASKPSETVEETLVADTDEAPESEAGPPEPPYDETSPAPEEGATLTDEPVPEMEPEEEQAPEPFEGAAMETTPSQAEASLAPSTEPEYASEYSPEVEPFLKRKEGDLVLAQRRFDRPTKMRMESLITSAPEGALAEKGWHPQHKTSLPTIHRAVDKLRVRRVKTGKWLKAKFKPVAAKPPARRLELIPAHIIAKRIVYETEGGFVVEVTYRDLGETRKKFFTVSSRGGRERALSDIQTGRYAETLTSVTDETIAGLGRPKRKAVLPVPPGKINTWPITNRYDVVDIEGIGEVYSRRLHELGIHTTDQLRLMNATVIANNLGAAAATVQKWQAMGELLCIKGIGKQYAESLVKAGVEGIEDLRTRKPKELAEAVKRAMDSSKPRLSGPRPKPARCWSFIRAARHLKKTLQEFPEVPA